MTALLRNRLLAVVAALFALSLAAPATAYHTDGSHDFGDPAFLDRWERTDRPVLDEEVDRTWMWGPEPYTEAMTEPYTDSPGDERLVQYFDKSRMEINDPDADANDLWYVTNGLLVVEMIDGKFQIGDDEFDWSPDPADVQIAGDPNDPYGPTYADIHNLGLRSSPAVPEGALIQQTIVDSEVQDDPHYAQYGVTGGHRVQVPGIDHTVADVFWEFVNSEGLVYEDGNYVEDRLFINPFYATGYPITEAYWQSALVAGVETDVLWQCFERRCLTFTPANDPGWQVEAGNVGQHYYEWRYRLQETETALAYLVDLEDPEAGIPYVLEGESLIGIEIEIPRHDDVEDRIAAALEQLFVLEHDDLHNEWTSSETSVSVENVQIVDGLARVNLTGEIMPAGTLSPPRLEAQLEQTAMQFDEVDDAIALLDGGPLTEPAARPSGGVLAIFEVQGEQFRLWSTNEDAIDELYALQSGERESGFPNGPIHHEPGVEGEPFFNLPWSWHLDPEETEIVDAAIEVCDGVPSYVEANVDYFVDTVGHYCPWSAELVDIIELDGS